MLTNSITQLKQPRSDHRRSDGYYDGLNGEPQKFNTIAYLEGFKQGDIDRYADQTPKTTSETSPVVENVKNDGILLKLVEKVSYALTMLFMMGMAVAGLCGIVLIFEYMHQIE